MFNMSTYFRTVQGIIIKLKGGQGDILRCFSGYDVSETGDHRIPVITRIMK